MAKTTSRLSPAKRESTAVESIRHKDKRKNIPTDELRDFVTEEEQATLRIERRITRIEGDLPVAPEAILVTARAGRCGGTVTGVVYARKNWDRRLAFMGRS